MSLIFLGILVFSKRETDINWGEYFVANSIQRIFVSLKRIFDERNRQLATEKTDK
jgi:hypothetical protein